MKLCKVVNPIWDSKSSYFFLYCRAEFQFERLTALVAKVSRKKNSAWCHWSWLSKHVSNNSCTKLVSLGLLGTYHVTGCAKVSILHIGSSGRPFVMAVTVVSKNVSSVKQWCQRMWQWWGWSAARRHWDRTSCLSFPSFYNCSTNAQPQPQRKRERVKTWQRTFSCFYPKFLSDKKVASWSQSDAKRKAALPKWKLQCRKSQIQILFLKHKNWIGNVKKMKIMWEPLLPAREGKKGQFLKQVPPLSERRYSELKMSK